MISPVCSSIWFGFATMESYLRDCLKKLKIQPQTQFPGEINFIGANNARAQITWSVHRHFLSAKKVFGQAAATLSARLRSPEPIPHGGPAIAAWRTGHATG